MSRSSAAIHDKTSQISNDLKPQQETLASHDPEGLITPTLIRQRFWWKGKGFLWHQCHLWSFFSAFVLFIGVKSCLRKISYIAIVGRNLFTMKITKEHEETKKLFSYSFFVSFVVKILVWFSASVPLKTGSPLHFYRFPQVRI